MLLNEDGCQFVLVSQFELSRLVTEELELLARGVCGDRDTQDSV